MQELTKEGSRSLSTPGNGQATEEDEGEELEGESASKYRALVDTLNYLSSDRPDMQFYVKEACREMAKTTTTAAWTKLERMGQYLKWKAQARVEVRVAGRGFDYRRVCRCELGRLPPNEEKHERRLCDARPALHQVLGEDTVTHR